MKNEKYKKITGIGDRGIGNRNRNVVVSILCSFLIAICSLFIACSGPLAGEDPSKGTIVLKLGGVPVSRAAATMGDIDYKIKLFNADHPTSNGIDKGTFKSGALAEIPVDPGKYRIEIAAYLSGAFYAEGGTDPDIPVEVKARSTTSVTIALTVDIAAYLNNDVFSSKNEIDLPLAVTLSSAKWGEILSAIDSASRNVNLDLSQCKRSTETSGGGLYSDGTFDPYPGPAYQFPPDPIYYSDAKALVKSLILPDAATAIKAGTAGGNYSFHEFWNMTTVDTGNGIQTIGDYAFDNLNINLTSVHLGNSVSKIGDCTFAYCSRLKEINFPASLTEIGTWAFYQNTALTSVTIPGGCSLGDNAFGDADQITTITVGEGGITYTGTTGIHDGFDAFADPSSTGTIPAGTYTWNSTSSIWQ